MTTRSTPWKRGDDGRVRLGDPGVQEIAYPDRTFEMWRYAVSHGQLLLRSTKMPEHSRRVDVLFKSVHHMKIPTLLHGLTVRFADTAEADAIIEATGMLPGTDNKLFVVAGAHYSGWVVAGVAVAEEDDREYYEESPLLDLSD